jgi:hypothetical protein
VSLLCFHPPLLLLLMSLSCPKSHPYRACHNCLTMAYGNASCFSAPELIMHCQFGTHPLLCSTIAILYSLPPENVAARCQHLEETDLRIFLYLICHDFRKINGRIKIFEKCTSGAVPHGGRLLPPYPTALSPCRRGARRQESGSCAKAGQRGARTLPPSGTAAVRTAVPHGGRSFYFF